MRFPFLKLHQNAWVRARTLGGLLKHAFGAIKGTATLDRWAALGLQAELWQVALEMSPEEEITGLFPDPEPAALIAAWIGWEGNPRELLEALVRVHLIELRPGGFFVVGLPTYQEVLESKVKERERKQAYREGKRQKDAHLTPVPRMSHGTTQGLPRDSTRQTQTQTQTQTQKEDPPPPNPPPPSHPGAQEAEEERQKVDGRWSRKAFQAAWAGFREPLGESPALEGTRKELEALDAVLAAHSETELTPTLEYFFAPTDPKAMWPKNHYPLGVYLRVFKKHLRPGRPTGRPRDIPGCVVCAAPTPAPSVDEWNKNLFARLCDGHLDTWHRDFDREFPPLPVDLKLYRPGAEGWDECQAEAEDFEAGRKAKQWPHLIQWLYSNTPKEGAAG